MTLRINPVTGKLDKVRSPASLHTLLDGRYVLVVGDTMTGPLVISPAGDTALTANKNIVLKAGQKLIFDGA